MRVLALLFISISLLAHVMACLFIWLGKYDSDLPLEDRESWLFAYASDFLEPVLDSKTGEIVDYTVEGKQYEIFVFSYYWVFETVTTVGYGDYVGKTSAEYVFSICLEFIGLSFFSLLMGVMGGFFNDGASFDALIEAKMDGLDWWVKKIEKSNKPLHINPRLYHSMTKTVRDAFMFDFNLIIEEFNLYQ